MKIIASRKDEILKRKSEYESDKAIRQSKYDEQYKKWDDAIEAVYNKVKSYIENGLSKFDKLDFDISVDSGFRGDGLRLTLECNEDDKFDETSALSWSYKASIDKNGEIKKETSSWSGLQATTSKQLDSLRQTLEALEFLNSVDWGALLNVDVPEYSNYINVKNPEYESAPEDFDRLLMKADIEDIIGTTSGVLSSSGDSKYYEGDVYRFIKSQTDKSFVVFDVPTYSIERFVNSGEMTSEELYHKYEDNYYRMSKTKFFNKIVEPMKILEF